MDIGIGLPSVVPGVDRDSLLEWARRAEARGFSSLGTIDRLVYTNYEPLTALAAAAAVTERIRLFTDILLVPWPSETEGRSCSYYGLGEGAREAADAELKHYYAWLGDELANMIAQSAAVDPDTARSYRDAFAEAGASELIYFPTSTEPGQVDLLADAVL
jgi:hypothetical protein